MNQNSNLPVEGYDLYLRNVNDTQVYMNQELKLADIFEAQAAKTPDATALIEDNLSLTYKELNESSNRLAGRLRDKGIKSDCLVAIIAERSVDMMVGILAILKAGGAYLPIDPNCPKARVEYILQDSKASILLTQSKFLAQSQYNCEVIDLNDKGNYKGSPHNLSRCGSSRDLSYIIYTSGSTGIPKGVMVEQRSVINRLIWGQKAYNIGRGDVILQKTPITFDVSVWELFWWMLAGAAVCMLKPGGEKDPEVIMNTVNRHKVSVIHFVPSMFSIFLDYIEAEESLKRLESLKKVYCSGEALSAHLVNKFNRILNKELGVKLYNLYGPTEATVEVSHFPCSEKEHYDKIPIGKPIDNVRFYIVNDKLEVQPKGVEGELCIAGIHLARGYLNQEALTKEKFVENPFEGESRIYRTGDLAKWLPDGNVEYLGRIDNQVKIRGYRIELGEIEEKIRQMEGVRDVAATTFDNGDGQKYICGYAITDREILEREIKEKLAIVLPQYMIPDRIVFMETFPLTASGKLDRKALPKPEEFVNTDVEYEAPMNEMEEVLLALWEEELKVKGIGINHNFFDLGGHSLKATRLKLKLSKLIKVNIPLPAFFENPTVKSLAQYIFSIGENCKYSSIPRLEESKSYPLSAAQKRMFLLNKMDKNAISYNIPLIYCVEGQLDREKLEKAFEKLLERHESLRTSFEIINGEPRQIIHAVAKIKIEAEKVLEPELDRAVKAFVKPFDLDKVPLMRIKVLELEKEKSLLLMDFHHIISDGVSNDILIEELYSYYNGSEPNYTNIQYKDYAAWHNEILTGEGIKEEEKYWLNRFAGELPSLNLPADFSRPKVKSYEGAKISFRITSEVKNILNELSRKNKATLFMTLLTAFQILLSKNCRQEDIIIGSPIANRQHPDVEKVVGMFVNTIPLRAFIAPENSFEELLTKVREETLKAYENQNYPFETLVDKLGIKRDPSRNPIFDVMFVLQNMDLNDMRLGDLKITPYAFDFKNSMFDMTLIATETDKDISFDLEYSTNIFKEATVKKLCNRFINLIHAITQKPDVRIIDLEMLDEEEKSQVLYDFNNTRQTYPGDKVIHQLFEEQAERHPQKNALIFEQKALTYETLNERANRVACILRQYGIKQNDIVAVTTGRCFEMIIGVLGVLKAGGAYLPIDPEYPEERKKYMLDDSGAKILLTAGGAVAPNDLGATTVLCLEDEIFLQGDGLTIENINIPVDLAYLIYTSGTTGKPKGVMVEHKGIANLKIFFEQNFKVSSKDKIIQFASMSFDAFVWETFMALLTGAELHIISKSLVGSYRDFEDYINLSTITIVTLPPPFLAYLLPENVQTLRMLITAGSAVSPEIVNKWKDKVEYVNAYGPTETTICATVWKHNGKLETYSSTPIGKPIFNSKAYVLDKNKKVLPIGVEGELYIAGDLLARGYLNRPELTKEKFVENPFSPGQLMYRTGDLARWLEDGNLEYLGRADDQVKIRGFRIEPKEIEAKLLENEKIIETVVVAKTKRNNPEKFLCAYYTASSEVTAKELRNALLRELPDYMIPAYFVQLEEMPLNRSGKIDKNALPEPDACINAGSETIKPRNEAEELLVNLWKEILAVENLSVIDNFFELGGNSLMAMALAFRIQKVFEINFPLMNMLKNPTIEDIAVEISSMKKNDRVGLEPADNREYYQLSPQQRRLYIQQELNESATNYNILAALDFKDEIDVKKLSHAFEKLIQRHDSLRTAFVYQENDVYQKVWDNVTFHMEYLKGQEEYPSLKPFKLSKAPLFRVYLVEGEGIYKRIYLEIHHLIFDGISLEIFFKELISLYKSEALADVKLQYKDYSQWINGDSGHKLQTEQEKFWMKTFERDIHVLNLPTDYERKTPMEYTGKILKFEIGQERTKAIKFIAAKNKATLFSIMLAIYNVFLLKITGQEDIVVGTPASGRSIPDLDGIIGMFVNTLCLRNDVRNELSFIEFLNNVKKCTIDAFENQEYQYNELVDKVVGQVNYSRNPIFDTMLAVQTGNLYSSEFSDSKLTILYDCGNYAMFDLNMQIFDLGEVLPVCWEYRTQLFKEETIYQFIDYFINIMDVVIENPDILLEEIQISKGFSITNINISDIEFAF